MTALAIDTHSLDRPAESAAQAFAGSRTPTRGELRLVFAERAGRTRLTTGFQSGCLRVRLPTTDGETAQAVLINTGGGVVGGDQLVQTFDALAGARAVLASQAAEKIYRSAGPRSVVTTRLGGGPGARLEWLPQETILFDRSRLRRRLDIELHPTATVLACEAVVFGRGAMGERLKSVAFEDAWRVRRGGRLIYADMQRLAGDVDGLLSRPSIADGAGAMALALLIEPECERRLAPLREQARAAYGRVAASAWEGLLAIRLLAPCGQSLRHDLSIVLGGLRDGAPLPRVWTC